MSENKAQPHDLPSQSAGVNFDDFMFPMNQKTNIEELQRQAYYDVLEAFGADSPATSSENTGFISFRFPCIDSALIIHDLEKEWKISDKTKTDFQNKIKKLRCRVSPQSFISTRMHGKDDLLLQVKAYRSVYFAIIEDEDMEAVKAGTKILKRLKTAWKISVETHISLEKEVLGIP